MVSNDNKNIKTMSLYFQPAKNCKQLIFNAKHCGRQSELSLDETHIIFAKIFFKSRIKNQLRQYFKQTISILISVGYSGLHQWQSDTAFRYK